MCGIYGIFDRARRPVASDLAKTLDRSLLHRGPDGSGQFFEPSRYPGLLLGNRRLSIIDLAGGNQPFVSDDGQIAVVQNGEIFNYVELQAELKSTPFACRSASDTEVILRLYERGGIDALKALNGMFAIAIWDGREEALYLIRDRVGEKPLYVRDDGVRIAFSSEIKTLIDDMAAQGQSPRMDALAIDQLLSLNYLPAPATAFEGIRHVMPGHVWRADTRGQRTWRWWNLAEQHAAEMPFSDWQAEFMGLLDHATHIRMRSDVPFGAFLSGGVDSSSIVGLMAKHTAQPVRTFCIGFADARFDESKFAQQAAERFGTEHTMEVAELDMLDRWATCIFHSDQPHGDASFMPTLRVSELAAKHVKVVLTGDGGDELFGGYEKYAAFFSRPGVSELDADAFGRAYFDSVSVFGATAKAQLYRKPFKHRVTGQDVFEVTMAPWLQEAAHMDRVNQALYFDTQSLLSGNNLVKPDRMGMAVSIENRAPFLDHRMLEFAFRTPGAHKLYQGDLKHRYKQAVIPLIGEHLALRKKQMFSVPIGEWFKGDRFGWLQNLLAGNTALADLFERAEMQRMLDAHRNANANYTRELRLLAAIALWSDRFGVQV